MVLAFYKKARSLLQKEGKAVLMTVTHHIGSSPGRQGFHMLATPNDMTGTIGGGIMEHKLVELSRAMLKGEKFTPFLKHQLHKAEATSDRSGMICSGEQTIAFFYFSKRDLEWMKRIDGKSDLHLHYDQSGVRVEDEKIEAAVFHHKSEQQWSFKMPVQRQSEVYVIGGGHVGLALCKVLSDLDFEIHLLDNRPDLNTVEENDYAHHKKIIRYEEVEKHISEGDHIYVVIISFGYRTDKVIIKQLLGRNYRYLGMMGSQRKIEVLWQELLEEGFSQNDLSKVVAPIGLDIKSETTHEIGISIAAQLIRWKNRGLGG